MPVEIAPLLLLLLLFVLRNLQHIASETIHSYFFFAIVHLVVLWVGLRSRLESFCAIFLFVQPVPYHPPPPRRLHNSTPSLSPQPSSSLPSTNVRYIYIKCLHTLPLTNVRYVYNECLHTCI
ncbi:uncharacterized protein EV422DRAFT_229927 [Fimicolochytrium jonesii]|uniref:uncharacterized protein n=1 Tax=Fimicolochytrium jonesii TaxID=1396493 RepID=UPI0022FED9D3|nr:uncharacterized protein EV422DRAFT_229927 [Fimicolochytrium jonesii]KAI8817273.1 hypothetical protein EV422DRAFT_229927 [Fimicolochytrium jonesii]